MSVDASVVALDDLSSTSLEETPYEVFQRSRFSSRKLGFRCELQLSI